MRTTTKLNLLAAVVSIGLALPASAVIQSDPNFTANGGRRIVDRNNPATFPGAFDSSLANSGAQYIGEMSNGFMGWPIGPRSFIGARHVSIGPGGTLNYQGQNYTVASRQDLTANFNVQINPLPAPATPVNATSDLSLYTIQSSDPSFTTFAPLLSPTDTLAAGNQVVLFGKGTNRGTPITATQSGGPVRGWYAGTNDNQISWGTNRIYIDGRLNFPDVNNSTFVFGVNLDPAGSPNATTFEGGLTGGDSSGAMFALTTSGEWKLAGIHSGVDGPVGYTNDPTGVPIAVSFDVSGLFASVVDGVVQTPGGPGQLSLMTSGRTSSFSTAIAFPQYYDVLVTAVPEPTTMMLLAVAGVISMRRQRK
jgi:PEP-CTERM motif